MRGGFQRMTLAAILLATFIVVLFGTPIISWYTGLIY